MSMLTEQCDKLRKAAYEVERIKNDASGMLMGDTITLADVAMQLREAADTIAALRNRLTETCHNVAEYPEDGFWPSPHFKCSECGASHVSMEYVRYCPSCGRRVVE